MEKYDGQIISVLELKKRWKCDFDFIFSLYAEYNSRYSLFDFPAWRLVAKRKRGEDNFSYLLLPCDLSADGFGNYYSNQLMLDESQINNIFFKLKDIERIEADQPALLYEPVGDPTIAEVAPGKHQIDQDQVARLPDGLLVVNPDAAKLPNSLPLPDAPQPPAPDIVTESQLTKIPGSQCSVKQVSELTKQIDKLKEELDFCRGELRRLNNQNEELFAQNLSLRDKLREAQKEAYRESKKNEDLNTKRRNSYLKVILALADSNSDISLTEYGAQTAIVNTVKAMDMNISTSTVGDIIKQAIVLQNEKQT